MEEGGSKGDTADTSLPNQVLYTKYGESSRSKDKAVVMLENDEVFRFTGRTGFLEEEKSVFQKPGYLRMQDAIPILPMRVSIVCLVLNFLCPGLGMFNSSFHYVLFSSSLCHQFKNQLDADVRIIF